MAYPEAVSSEAITRLFTRLPCCRTGQWAAALPAAGLLMVTFMNELERGRLSHVGEATVQMEGKWVSGHQACQPKGPDSPSILRLLVVAPWETS